MKNISAAILMTAAALSVFMLTGCDAWTESLIVKEDEAEADGAGTDGTTAQSAELTQEFEYYSDTEDGIYVDIPEIIELDGDTYELAADVELETVDSESVVMKVVENEVEDVGDIEETMEYEGPSGTVYTLTNEQVYISESDTEITVPVTENVVYEEQFGKPGVASTKTITYYNRATGEDEETTGTLTDLYESVAGHWESTLAIDGVFQAPSSNTTEFYLAGTDNVTVSQSAETPVWDGWEGGILTSLGLSPEYYRLTAAAWNGSAYTQDGYVYRNAVFTGDMYVSTWTAVYEGSGTSLGYKATVHYFADADEVDADGADVSTIYTIRAVAAYVPVQ